jgi:hypothetical protein
MIRELAFEGSGMIRELAFEGSGLKRQSPLMEVA